MKKYNILCLTILLVCCSTGNHYTPPKTELPKQWHTLKNPVLSEQKLLKEANISKRIKDPWWEEFHDPTLSLLISRAISRNQEVKIAAARILEAKSYFQNSKSSLWPEINLKGSSTKGNLGNASLGGDLSLYQSNFDVAWELDLFGHLHHLIEAKNAAYEATHYDYFNVLLSLISQVAQEYIIYRKLQHELKLTQDTVQTQNKLLEITQDRLKAGLASNLDFAQSKALYKKTLARVPDIERQIKESSFRLSLFLGEFPGSLSEILEPVKPLPKIKELTYLQEPAYVLSKRPDVQKSERELATAFALHNASISDLYPNLTIGSIFGIQDSRIPHESFFYSRKLWSIGSNLSFPLFNFGRIQSKIDAANAQQVQAFHHYKNTLLKALNEVETYLSHFFKENESCLALEHAAQASKDALKVAHERYHQGLTDFTSILQVETYNYEVQIQLVSSQANSLIYRIALYKAMGLPGLCYKKFSKAR